MERTVGRRINAKIPFLVFLAILFIGLPTSKFLMTVSQIAVLFFWMIDGIEINKLWNPEKSFGGRLIFALPSAIFQLGLNIISKLREFFRNKPAVILSSIYLLHLIGLFWTNHDLSYALKDLRIKLPLLYFPIVFATSVKIDWKVFRIIFWLYLSTILVTTFYGMYLLLVPGIVDAIELSPFISHIRFSLNVLLAIGIIIYFLIHLQMSTAHRLGLIVSGIWLAIYLIMMESLTGVSILMTGIVLLGAYYIFRIRHRGIRIGIISALLIIIVSVIGFGVNTYYDYSIPAEINVKTLEKKTIRGNAYVHDTNQFGVENGHYIGVYLCYKELRQAWDQRSEIKYLQKDNKQQTIKYTLIRYLNSKGFRKDYDGVMSLSEEDVKNIENGIANAEYANPLSVKKRLYKVFYGFSSYTERNNPNRSSLMQRIEYWKTSLKIIGDQPVFGVGTGDMDHAFHAKYEEMKTPLKQEWRRRSHNQYLAIMVAFGVFGLLWFLTGLLLPAYINGAIRQPLFIIFLFIGMLSMLWEDTLESQAGLTFFILLYCVFCFAIDYKSFGRTLTDSGK